MCNNKTFLWITALFLSGAFCAVVAIAEVAEPDAYQKLTAVELAPEHMPMLQGGMSGLSGLEGRHRERLPMQLEGVVKKIKKTNYSPRAKKAKAKPLRF